MDFNKDQGNELISQIQLNIQKLNRQVQELDNHVEGLSERNDVGEENRRKFNLKASEAQDVSKDLNSLMRKLVDLSNDNRALKMHRERLQNDYIGVLNRLQAAQRKAAQAEKNSMKQVREAAEQDAEAQRQADEFERGFAQPQMQRQQQVNIQEIKERTQALQQLEQDIGDVNRIFAELARIVHEQGDVVDSIEANVEHAQIHVEEGAQQVQQAVYYNQKSRQKKMLLFGFLTILVFIIGLTVYLAR